MIACDSWLVRFLVGEGEFRISCRQPTPEADAVTIELMSVPPAPPPLEQLGQRPFSFYPAILNVVHNEWLYRKANWSEVLVQNTRSHEEVWVPRRYLGAVSRVDEPVMIVGLAKELEYKGGAVWPAERRVIEMPRAVNEGPRPGVAEASTPRPAPVVGIKLENGAESRIGRMVLGGIALGIVGCVLAVSLYRGGILGNKIVYAPVLQSDLGLSAADDYFAVVRILGHPADDRWRSDRGEMQYRLLDFPQLGCYVILMGRDRREVRYIGALDRKWLPVHTVPMPGHADSASLLRSLKRF